MTSTDSTVVALKPSAHKSPSQIHWQQRRHALDRFLAGVERQAFHRARMAVGNVDDALEIVQEAMLKLTRSYSEKPEAQWPLLFQRVLQNSITDFHRRKSVRSRVLSWVSFRQDDPDEELPLQEMELPDPAGRSPLENLLANIATQELQKALEALPLQQQQVFLLRHWDGFSTAEAAYALSCSEGTIKTQLSRALNRLRRTLKEVAP